MGCKIQRELGLHGLLLLSALILWVRQQSHKNTQTKRVKKKKVQQWLKDTCVHTEIQISSQSSTEHRTDLDYSTSTRTER